jgi:hypothetical protein
MFVGLSTRSKSKAMALMIARMGPHRQPESVGVVQPRRLAGVLDPLIFLCSVLLASVHAGCAASSVKPASEVVDTARSGTVAEATTRGASPATSESDSGEIDITTLLVGTMFEGAIAPLMAERWGEARRQLDRVHTHLPILEELVVEVLLGRAFHGLGDRAAADASFEKVEALLHSSEARALDDAVLKKEGTASRVVFSVIGENYFLRAERMRALADELRRPLYTGPDVDQEILQFLKDVYGPWIEARTNANEAAETAYSFVWASKTDGLPSRLVIAAARRGGDLPLQMFEGEPSIPIPPRWRDNPEALRYFGLIQSDGDIGRLRRRARRAFNVCVSVAQAHHVENDHVTRCRAALSSLSKLPALEGDRDPDPTVELLRSFPRAAGLRLTPSRSSRGCQSWIVCRSNHGSVLDSSA